VARGQTAVGRIAYALDCIRPRLHSPRRSYAPGGVGAVGTGHGVAVTQGKFWAVLLPAKGRGVGAGGLVGAGFGVAVGQTDESVWC
jgi:hypothetical protein